jgi:glycosyltransferase involved in cell wall biosynthesis
MSARIPKVSVCMPTYNHGSYIEDALGSVLCQSRQDFEIIVYDDASTDSTSEVVDRFTDPRIRHFHNVRNAGIAATRNACLDMARGEYIAWLDSDDRYHQEMLAQQSAILDRSPRVGLVHAAFEVIDDVGRRLPDWKFPFANDCIEAGHEAFRELVLLNYVTAPTVMVRRECYERVGKYSSNLGNSGEDWDMWLRIAAAYDIAYNANALAQYRQHANNNSTTSYQSGEQLRHDSTVIKHVFGGSVEGIENAGLLHRRARAALAAKELLYAGDVYTRGKRGVAFWTTLRTIRLMPPLLLCRPYLLLLVALLFNREYGVYRQSKMLLGVMAQALLGTRFGDRLEQLAGVDAEWEHTLYSIARTVQRIVSSRALVAVIDKCDPTLMSLSRRKGWHFPDRRLLPHGYPSTDDGVITHLQRLHERGAEYLVVPSAAFWWLDYYDKFRHHLETQHDRVWSDDECVIYRLAHVSP